MAKDNDRAASQPKPTNSPDEKWELGTERWDVYTSDGKTLEMIRREDGRGSIVQGETVLWGSWIDGFLYLDEPDEKGGYIRVDRYGGQSKIIPRPGQPPATTPPDQVKPAVVYIRAVLEQLGINHRHLADIELARIASEIENTLNLVVCARQ